MSLFIRTLCLILFCFPVVGFPQQEPTEKPQSERIIRLFTDREDVHKLWGKPEKYYVRPLERYLSREELVLVERLSGLVDDVYFRKTAKNHYEVRFRYRECKYSKWCPDSIVVSVVDAELLLEKPAPAFEILRDLPETRDLCRSGCGLYLRIHKMQLVAYPNNLTPKELTEGFMVMKGWNKAFAELVESLGTVPAVVLGWKEATRNVLLHSVKKPQDLDWLQQPIEWISFGLENPQMDFSSAKADWKSSNEYLEFLKEKGIEPSLEDLTEDRIFDLGSFIP